MAKISVIVPVFNSQQYIELCIKTLLAQTLDDIELIFVDDHGSDDSVATARRICESYVGSKSIVFTETPSNSGPGIARNVGIGVASGEYVAFVDSDDTIASSFCEKLYSAAVANDAEMVCCNVQKGDDIYVNPDVDDKRYFLTHFITYSVSFIYRRRFLEELGIFFPGTRASEDSCFLISALLSAKKLAKVGEVMYYYNVHESSISTSRNRKRTVQRLRSFHSLHRFVKKNNLEAKYRRELFSIYLKKCFGMALKDLICG